MIRQSNGRFPASLLTKRLFEAVTRLRPFLSAEYLTFAAASGAAGVEAYVTLAPSAFAAVVGAMAATAAIAVLRHRASRSR